MINVTSNTELSFLFLFFILCEVCINNTPPSLNYCIIFIKCKTLNHILLSIILAYGMNQNKIGYIIRHSSNKTRNQRQRTPPAKFELMMNGLQRQKQWQGQDVVEVIVCLSQEPRSVSPG